MSKGQTVAARVAKGIADGVALALKAAGNGVALAPIPTAEEVTAAALAILKAAGRAVPTVATVKVDSAPATVRRKFAKATTPIGVIPSLSEEEQTQVQAGKLTAASFACFARVKATGQPVTVRAAFKAARSFRATLG